MEYRNALSLRYILGAIIVLMMGFLMYTKTVPVDTGIVVIIGVAAALGIYERYRVEE